MTVRRWSWTAEQIQIHYSSLKLEAFCVEFACYSCTSIAHLKEPSFPLCKWCMKLLMGVNVNVWVLLISVFALGWTADLPRLCSSFFQLGLAPALWLPSGRIYYDRFKSVTNCILLVDRLLCEGTKCQFCAYFYAHTFLSSDPGCSGEDVWMVQYKTGSV